MHKCQSWKRFFKLFAWTMQKIYFRVRFFRNRFIRFISEKKKKKNASQAIGPRWSFWEAPKIATRSEMTCACLELSQRVFGEAKTIKLSFFSYSKYACIRMNYLSQRLVCMNFAVCGLKFIQSWECCLDFFSSNAQAASVKTGPECSTRVLTKCHFCQFTCHSTFPAMRYFHCLLKLSF